MRHYALLRDNTQGDGGETGETPGVSLNPEVQSSFRLPFRHHKLDFEL